MIMVLLFCATAATAAESTLRLRIAWGGGDEERQWKGAVRVSSGTLAEVQPLGIEADEAGSIWLDPSDPGGVVRISQRSARLYDGFDVLVTAELDAKLTIELEAVDLRPADPSQRPAEVPTKSLDITLSKLLSESESTRLDSGKNRLLVMRAPGDRLRVQFERDSLVFSPGEVFPLEIQPHSLGLPPGTPIRVKAQLTAVHVAGAPKDRLWSNEFDAVTPAVDADMEPKPVEIKLPEAEGVYDLTIAAIDARLAERLRWKKPAAERKVQLVIVGDARPAEAADGPSAMTKMLEIDPANPRWYDRLTNLTLVPGLKRGPLGSGDAARWDHPAFGPMIQLGAEGGTKKRAGADDVPWESYPLPISDPGQPHILEVAYPSNVPQTLGISIVEPNAAGAVMPIGLDSGVYVTREEADEPPRLLKHRVVFWPRTKSPLLLITNRGDRSPAVYGKIGVLGMPQSQLSMLKLGQKSPSNVPLPRAVDAARFLPRGKVESTQPGGPRQALAPQGRLFAGYFDRPLFVENFAAPESMDVFNRRSLDDWVTFYLGSQRLIEYLNHVGYNGLVLSVLADGSTIYPTTRIESTPQYDTGVFFGTGQDPVRKDVLEVLFRMFDREGLTLIPTIQFAAPLAELESLKRDGAAESIGLELIGIDGRRWTDRTAPNKGLAPHYNPLHPRVQEAMLGIVAELANRYGQHPAFGGLAIQLTADGYAQLPGADWGYDDDTIERFVRESQFEDADGQRLIAKDSGRFAVRAELLSGKLKQPWLLWRAAKLAALYRQMKEIVPGELTLLGGALFESPVAQRGLRPALPRRTKIDDVLLAFGLRPQSYGRDSGINFIRPYRIGPTGSGVDAELNLSPDVDQVFAATAGNKQAMFYHQPIRTRLESFDEQSPFGKTNTYTWLAAQFSPSGDRNRRRFAHSIAVQDTQSLVDGGWLLPLGQEHTLVDFISTYRQLPAATFTTLEETSEPVVIRTLTQGRETYVYFVNDSPWQVSLHVAVDAPEQVRVERIGPAKKLPPLVRQPGAGVGWKLDLQPFDLVAAKFSAPNVRISQPRVIVDEAIRAALAKRINDLTVRVAALANPMHLAVLSNPGFEAEAKNGQIPGWGMQAPAGTSALIDQEGVRGSKQSLRLTSTGPRIIVRSDVIDAPRTGRLGVSLWLKAATGQNQPIVRLAVESQINGIDDYRSVPVGGNGAKAVPIPITWTQQPTFKYQVDDLPQSGVTNLKLRFDLIGAGEVWIDDIQLTDLTFEENERIELSKLVTNADYMLNAGLYSGCLRLLDGHWPRYLMEHQGPGPLARRPMPPRLPVNQAPAPVAPPKKPGMFDRFKDIVPKFQ